jgi:hypothetical protein
MAYTKTVEYLSFDSTTAILYVRIQFFYDSVLYNTTRSYPIQLPVDSLGQVPTGSALEAYIDQIVEVVYSPAAQQVIRNLINFGGVVTNADEIFSLTPEEFLGINLILAVGTNMSTPTATLIVEDASELVAMFEAGPWYLTDTTQGGYPGFPVRIVEINGNNLTLDQEIEFGIDNFEIEIGDTFNVIPG